ncbi:MAG: hypothetical protein ACP5KW_12085 [Thermoproteota archaeon]
MNQYTGFNGFIKSHGNLWRLNNMSEILQETEDKLSGQYLLISSESDVTRPEQKLESSTLPLRPQYYDATTTVTGLKYITCLRKTAETWIFSELLELLLHETQYFMKGLGFSQEKDFQVEISKWSDPEVEEWSYTQLRITLLNSTIDKFMILKSLTELAKKLLPKDVLQEIVILVE